MELNFLGSSSQSNPSSRRGTLAKLASIDEILEYEQEIAIMDKLNLNAREIQPDDKYDEFAHKNNN